MYPGEVSIFQCNYWVSGIIKSFLRNMVLRTCPDLIELFLFYKTQVTSICHCLVWNSPHSNCVSSLSFCTEKTYSINWLIQQLLVLSVSMVLVQ